jgi:ParB family transcriptional regulator, chromosome partitioning protein
MIRGSGQNDAIDITRAITHAQDIPMADTKRSALGKGLSALIPDAPEPQPGVVEVDVDRLRPNQYQPRRGVDDTRLDELASSIKAHGVIQPIVVRRVDGEYHIIAGERRWRAAQRAGLTRVPVVVREVSDKDPHNVLEMALIENIQRENLNAIEEGLAYRRLGEEFGLTQDAIATAVGKDRSTVANVVRLLKLPDEIQQEVAAGRLSMGHARALLALADESSQLALARDILARGLSVREAESLVRKAQEPASPPAPQKAPPPPDVHTRAAEDTLRLRLGTRVRIVRRGQKGRIEIDFVSEEELIRIYDALTG